MKDIKPQRMKELIERFRDKKVLVLGDLMLDKYIWGDVARISPEAPVPVVEVKGDTSCLGGAGNVYLNLESLGASPLAVGVVGEDAEGRWIRSNVRDSRGIFTAPQRPTTVKTRIIAHSQQVVRVDREKKSPISSDIEKKIGGLVRSLALDGIVISDYNKGLITRRLMKDVLAAAQAAGVPVFVDPKVENFFLYSPVTLITPNHVEAAKAVHGRCLTDEQVEAAGGRILSRVSTRYLIIKRGEKGLSVIEPGKPARHIPARAKEVFDVTGAGDTVIAAASLALLAGGSIMEAALMANAAAGVVVGKIGTAAVSAEELVDELAR